MDCTLLDFIYGELQVRKLDFYLHISDVKYIIYHAYVVVLCGKILIGEDGSIRTKFGLLCVEPSIPTLGISV
jgi:hypothetical protein